MSTHRIAGIILAIAVVMAAAAAGYGYWTTRIAVDDGFRDTSLSVDERVEILLAQMTLEEKVGQMALVDKNSIRVIGDVAAYGIGGILSGGGAKPDENTPEGWLAMVRDYDEASRGSRLGIPALYGVDAVHGHGNVPQATIFPHAIGLGAANDVALVERVAAATAEEVLATGISWILGPNLDLPQDIRWGRVYDAFSSDPVIAADLGAAYVRGLQGRGALGSAKHYVGVGAMLWSTSENPSYRIDQGATNASETDLREQFLPPFKAAVDAGVWSVMAGLNMYGGEKVSGSRYLLTDVLKGELGFDGFIVSDWHGVYELPGDHYASAITAIEAGIDMVMLPFDYKEFVSNVTRAVREGDLSEERVDDAVHRILRAKFATGLFERLPRATLDSVGSIEHRALAREAVSASLVLLRNQNTTLPIASSTQRIAVAGSSADDTGRQSGGWTVEWQGIEGNQLPGATSILAGIKDAAGPDVTVLFDKEGRFALDGTTVDIGIVVVGERPYSEGVGDDENPTLSPEDLAAIERVRAVSDKVVVIIVSGRPLILPAEAAQWDAIIAAWLPGSEGAGVADVLFGTKPFVGKLPLPWPTSVSQLPFMSGDISSDGTAPLYPIGFGL